MAMGERRDIGWYEELLVRSLSGFLMGMVMAFFQICGILLDWILWFMSWVKARRAVGPRCLRWRAESPSGPVAGEFLACFIARETSRVVKGVKVEDGSERMASNGELSGYFVWMGRVDGCEFMVQCSCDGFVFVVCFVVEEGDGGVWVWLFGLVQIFYCVPKFVLVCFVVK